MCYVCSFIPRSCSTIGLLVLGPRGLHTALGSQACWPGRTRLIWIPSAWFLTCTFVHACVRRRINAFALSHSCSDGQKMSKRKKNYPDPGLIVQNYGADALRSVLCLSVSKCASLKPSARGRVVCARLPYVLKGLYHHLRLSWTRPRPTYSRHTPIHTLHTVHMHSHSVCPHTFSPLPWAIRAPWPYGLMNKALCSCTICWHI